MCETLDVASDPGTVNQLQCLVTSITSIHVKSNHLLSMLVNFDILYRRLQNFFVCNKALAGSGVGTRGCWRAKWADTRRGFRDSPILPLQVQHARPSRGLARRLNLEIWQSPTFDILSLDNRQRFPFPQCFLGFSDIF